MNGKTLPELAAELVTHKNAVNAYKGMLKEKENEIWAELQKLGLVSFKVPGLGMLSAVQRKHYKFADNIQAKLDELKDTMEDLKEKEKHIEDTAIAEGKAQFTEEFSFIRLTK